MIVPVFSLRQDDKFVYARIRAPLCKVSEAEVEMGGHEMLFAAPPYHLRLYLPKEVVENGEESAEYDADTQTYTVRMPKALGGEEWAGLEMVTKLLTPPGLASAQPLVQEIPTDPQDLVPVEVPDASGVHPDGYGFGGRRHGVVKALREELALLFPLPDGEVPDDLSRDARAALAEQIELDKFQPEHYLADLLSGEEEAGAAMRLRLPWAEEGYAAQLPTQEEAQRLKDLPKRLPALVLEANMSGTLATLGEILFGYAYDLRTSDGELSPEAAWNISKLSVSLSCLTHFEDEEWDAAAAVRRSVTHTLRRALAFPLLRRWDLAHRCLGDVVCLLAHGRVPVLRALLAVHGAFAGSENRHVLNELWVTEYLLWVQHLPDDRLLHGLRDSLIDVAAGITKEELGLCLEEVELSAEMAALGTGDGEGADEEEEDAALQETALDPITEESSQSNGQSRAGETLDSDDDEPEDAKAK